jgi:type 1 glutamine amidotransferase
MRTLVICDDPYHPARIPRAGLAALGEVDFTFDWIEHASEWSAQRMSEYPLTILTKANHVSFAERQPWSSEEMAAAFAEYVQQGNGLLVIHSGTAGYSQLPALRDLLGGVFVKHPPQCPVTVAALGDHPLTAGCTPFTLLDEHYHMEMADPNVELFLTATSEHGTQPAGWTRTAGAGRVAVLTPGHNLEIWLHPSFQALLRNSLRWCGKK